VKVGIQSLSLTFSAWKLDEFKNRKVLELVFKMSLKLVKVVEFLA
jgi:hypothetical protein